MKTFLKENAQFIILCFLWVIVGRLNDMVAHGFVALSVFLLYRRNMLLEIFIGFVFILTLSDNRMHALDFAKTAKNTYIVMITLIILAKKTEEFVKMDLYRYIMTYTAFAAICLIYAPSDLVSTAFQKTLSYFLLFLIIPNYISLLIKMYDVRFYKNLFYSICLILIFGLITKYIAPDFSHINGRFRGLLGNPNGLGIYTSLILLSFLVTKDLLPNLFNREDMMLIIGSAGISLLLSGSRNSIVTVLIFILSRYIFKKSITLGIITFILFALLYQIVDFNVEQIILSLGLGNFFRVDTLKNGSGRLVAWEFAFLQIKESIYLGRGINYTEWIYAKYFAYLNKLGHQGAAHNAYLTIWLDTGLLGLISYLTGLFALFIRLAKSYSAAIPLLFAILFSNQFESWITASLNPFTIFLVMMITSIILIREKQIVTDSDPEVETSEVKLANAVS